MGIGASALALTTEKTRFDWGLAMGLGVPRFAAHRLIRQAGSLRTIRNFTQQTLAKWALGPYADDATVIVNELVSNVLGHAAPTAAPTTQPTPQHIGWLALMDSAGTLFCAVTDYGPGEPVLASPALTSETGRGLHMVAALSHAWGFSHQSAAGKTIWARLPTTPTVTRMFAGTWPPAARSNLTT
ncbi:ATP-binding protein [Kitasatospora sp. NPDC101801]|uniref:ATP-binding protein n=1 Tax=Kitasatospora sp. NPDC101801 TaxID=3364103 RepID=UPI0038200D0C